MATPPTLETPRLRLVPFDKKAHLTERYVEWLNDPDVVRYSEQRHHHHNIETCRTFVRHFENSPSLLWAMEETERSHGHIGNIHADVDAPNLIADVAIVIGEKSEWGHGLAEEAWAAVVDYLLGDGGMRKVTAGCMAENLAMVRIMDRAGMHADGAKRDHFLLDGRPVDAIYRARFRHG